MALVNIPNDIDYNSYVTNAELNQLVAELDISYDLDKWDALSEIKKERVAKQATKDANSIQYSYSVSSTVVSAHNMKWPANSAAYENGVDIGKDVIPLFMKEYIAARSVEITEISKDQTNQLTLPNNVKKSKIGSLEEEFFSSKEMAANTLSLTDYSSYEILKPYACNRQGFVYLQRA